MAKGGTIEYGIKFNVDKSSLSAIQSELQAIQRITTTDFAKKNNMPFGDAQKQLTEIRESAKQLQHILNESFNTKLGTVNLEKFNAAFNKIDAKSLVRNLNAAGIQGSQALRNLTTEVLTVNVGFKQTNKLVESLNTTLKNTVKWGLSSAMFNGMTRAISNAWNYAKDLDSSLNSIRRVSNASAEDMERFAKYANKAAQSMGKSTLDYTKGALIYFQQGLSEEEAKKRTDITMKMSNVLGASADEVSNYMTAIWNNFAQGSDNLEHFADVLAKLGAETASSAEEISTGLEKFAAIGNTVGLSYEYAAAALATVTATTRQSADTVGTAFKTLFSRIQGLKLGETLDDGTTLNKYSAELDKIGVKIKDSSGNLKDMDQILEEMGSKWEKLTDAQKVAVAQTVGGVRQYSQLIALMDNWDYFKENLNRANNATGELQRQQDIYMQSSQAHLEQLGAAVERIKGAFIDNKGINSFIDRLTDVANLFGGFLESIGGGGTALLMLGSIATKVFGKTIAESIGTAIINMRLHNQQVDLANAKLQAIKAIEGSGATAQDSAIEKLVEMEKEFLALKDVATEEDEKTTNQFIIQRNELEQVNTQWEEAKKQAQEYYDIINSETDKKNQTKGFNIEGAQKEGAETDTANTNIQNMLDKYSKFSKEASEKFSAAWAKEQQKSTKTTRSNIEKQVKEYEKAANKIIKSNLLSDGKLKAEMAEILNELKIPDDDQDYAEKSQKLVDLVTKASEQITAKIKMTGEVINKEVDGRSEDLRNAIQNAEQDYNRFIENLKTTQMVQGFLNIASGIGQVAAGLQALGNIDDILSDDTISKGEKFLKVISALSMGFTSLAMGAKTIGSGFVKLMTTIPSASAALNGMTVSTALQSKAFGALAVSAGKALLAILPYVAIAAAVAGAAYLIYNAITADEREYKSFQEAQENLTKQSEELTNSIQDLKKSWESLQNAEHALDGCVDSSEEWKNKLKEVNSQVEAIIEKYPDLLNIEGIVKNTNGRLSLDESKFNEYLSNKEQSLNTVNYAKLVNQSKIYEKDRQKALEEVDVKTSYAANGPTYNLSEADQRRLGQVGLTKQGYNDIVKEIANAYATEHGYTGVNAAEVVNPIVDSLQDEQKTFQEIVKSLNNIDTKVANINTLMVPEKIQQSGGYASALWKGQNKSNDIVQQLLDAESWGVFKSSEEFDEDAQVYMRMYQKAMGQKFDQAKFTNVDYGDENRQYEYNGERITRQEMAAVIAAYIQNGGKFDETDIYDNSTSKATKENYNKYLDASYNLVPSEAQISQQAEKAKNALSKEYGIDENLSDKILSRDIDSLTPEEINKVKEIVESGADLKATLKKIGVNTDADSKSGLSSVDDYLKGVSKLKTQSQAEIDQYNRKEFRSKANATADELETDRNGFAEYTEELIKNSKALKENDEFAIKAAAGHYKLAQKLDGLSKSLSDNKDVLNKWKLGKSLDPNEMAKVGESITKVKDVLGQDVSEDFVKQHLEDIRKLANGDISVLDNLQKELAKDYILNINADWEKDLPDDVQQLIDYIHNLDIENIEIGTELDVDVADQLQTLLDNCEITTEQANKILSQIGYEPNIETVEATISESNGETATLTYTDPKTLEKKTISNYATTQTSGVIQIPYINAGKTRFVGANKNSFKYKPTNKSSGSGKKGGGGSSSKPKTMDTIDDEADRYHKVNTQIAKVDNQLKKVQSQQQKLVGAKLIENLNKQWNLLNIQVQNYNEKLRIANGEQKELADKLKKQGVIFNADGTIANYMEAFQAQENYVNGLINQYNRLSKKQQETWDNNKTIDKAKENFNKFKENMDRYDTLVANEIPGLEQSILDSIDKQIELNIQKFNLELTVTLNMNQATRDWNAWKKKVIDGIKDDDILGNSRARLGDFSTYFRSNGAGDIQAYTRQVNNILKELKQMDETGSSTVYGDNRQKALDELKEKYTSLMESMTQELELEEELYQNILDEMDKVQEKFDQQIESYQFLRDILNHDIKVIQMVYGEDSYGDLAKFYERQQKNYENQLDFQRQQKEFWYAEMQAAEKGSEEWEKAKENWVKAVNEFNNILEEGLENAKNKFQNAINDIFKNLNNTVTGGMGLDYVNEQWNLINQNADRYLDTINKSYGIRALERKYTDAINKSTNINAQQKLKKIMDEQLEDLKQRDRLTQYDLDRANKLYDIELARLALEEAQMNKSQMRLRRDSQGNYTYQYVANDDKIAEAEAKIEDLYNQLYNFDKERYNAVLNDAYNAWNEYQQKMAEAAMINDPQQRAEREMLIQEEYDQLLTQIEQDYQISRYTLQQSFFAGLELLTEESLNNINTSYGTALVNADGTTTVTFDNITNTVSTAFGTIEGLSDETFGKLQGHFDELSDKERAIVMESLIPTWENGISQMVQYFIGGASGKGGMQAVSTNFKDAVSSMQELFTGKDGKGGFVNATKDGWDKIKTAEHTYQTDLGALEKVAGQTFDKIKNGEDEAYQKAQPLINKNNEVITTYEKELKAVKDVYDQVIKLKDAYNQQAEASKKAATEAYNYYQKELEIQRQKAAAQTTSAPTSTTTTNTTTTSTPTPTTTTTTNTPKTGTGNGTPEVGDVVTYIGGKYYGDSYGGNGYGTRGAGKNLKVKITKIVNGRPYPIHVESSDAAYGWLKKDQISGYDTGGYTGTWGNSGRLAMLHQKELVLNAQDTENMLNTVAIMRGLAYSLGSNMLSRLAGATATGYSGGGSDNGILEQNVHIDATFPSVKNATEIEEALNNLVNAASQRAYERR